MKPDWSDAPEWANYLAMDNNGDWYWYEEKPEICCMSWLPSRFAKSAMQVQMLLGRIHLKNVTKPNLLCITGNRVIRYVNGKSEQIAEVQHCTTIELLKQQLEHFRLNGLPDDAK